MLNVFSQNAFDIIQMTAAINAIPYVPGHLSAMGLFETSGITATTVAIEEQSGTLGLLSPTPRGGPGQTTDKEKRTIRSLAVPHFQLDDAVMADEVQGVREFGTQDQLQTVINRVNARMASRVPYFDATLEYQRIGAVKGIITYADSTTLNLFTEFGVSQEAEQAFDLTNNSASLAKKCMAVQRLIATNLGGLPYSGIHAFVGDNFFDDLVTNAEAVDTYKYQQGAALRDRLPYRQVTYGGITFENYRGGVGATAFVHTDKAHFFPVGVPGLFQTWFAPADYMETVNTVGLPRYAKPILMDNGKGMRLEMQSNPLSICTRPKVLIQGKRGA